MCGETELMTRILLNTPIQAQHLAYLYGEPAIHASKWLVVGDEQYVTSWASYVRSMTVHALRSWDETKINQSENYTGVYLHLEPEQSWESIVPKIKAENVCVIRHGLPIGTLLREAYEQIPDQYLSGLPKNDSYGQLMNRISNQATPKNPIDRTALSHLMSMCGWRYVCDLCTYRDFGHETEVIEKRDALCGLVWRDSLFIRTTPKWQLHETYVSHLWRVQAKQRVSKGWVYTTPEGLQLGFQGDASLEEYVDWTGLCSEQKKYIHSFVHSGLLALMESKL